MESGPAIFTGAVFALLGGGLLAWTGARVRHRRPVAEGVDQTVATTVAVLTAVIALGAAAYCLTRL